MQSGKKEAKRLKGQVAALERRLEAEAAKGKSQNAEALRAAQVVPQVQPSDAICISNSTELFAGGVAHVLLMNLISSACKQYFVYH